MPVLNLGNFRPDSFTSGKSDLEIAAIIQAITKDSNHSSLMQLTWIPISTPNMASQTTILIDLANCLPILHALFLHLHFGQLHKGILHEMISTKGQTPVSRKCWRHRRHCQRFSQQLRRCDRELAPVFVQLKLLMWSSDLSVRTMSARDFLRYPTCDPKTSTWQVPYHILRFYNITLVSLAKEPFSHFVFLAMPVYREPVRQTLNPPSQGLCWNNFYNDGLPPIFTCMMAMGSQFLIMADLLDILNQLDPNVPPSQALLADARDLLYLAAYYLSVPFGLCRVMVFGFEEYTELRFHVGFFYYRLDMLVFHVDQLLSRINGQATVRNDISTALTWIQAPAAPVLGPVELLLRIVVEHGSPAPGGGRQQYSSIGEYL